MRIGWVKLVFKLCIVGLCGATLILMPEGTLLQHFEAAHGDKLLTMHCSGQGQPTNQRGPGLKTVHRLCRPLCESPSCWTWHVASSA